MFKEIELDGKGWARGRNGYFVPRRAELFRDVRGQVNLEVWSKRRGNVEPVFLRVSRDEALELARAVIALAGGGEPKTPRVVVVVEGGNVQEILSDQPVDVVKVDYDVEGMFEDDLRLVAQVGEGGKKTYALAWVRHWGEALVSPGEAKRFFRTALD